MATHTITSKKRGEVHIRKMTLEEARKLFKYRPYSKYAETRFGGNNLYDDIAMLLNQLATRCITCQAPIRNNCLRQGVCPDCDGRAAHIGYDPGGSAIVDKPET